MVSHTSQVSTSTGAAGSWHKMPCISPTHIAASAVAPSMTCQCSESTCTASVRVLTSCQLQCMRCPHTIHAVVAMSLAGPLPVYHDHDPELGRGFCISQPRVLHTKSTDCKPSGLLYSRKRYAGSGLSTIPESTAACISPFRILSFLAYQSCVLSCIIRLNSDREGSMSDASISRCTNI